MYLREEDNRYCHRSTGHTESNSGDKRGVWKSYEGAPFKECLAD